MNVPEELTCDEFKQLAPAYVLLALEDVERRACARHLAVMAPHQGCPQVLAQAELVAARLGGALAPQMPPSHLWRSLRARLDEGDHPGDDRVTALVPGTPLEEAARRRGFYQICGWLVAATLLGLYLHHAPFDFSHKHPGADLGSGLRGGLTPHALAAETR